jgi:hypothetical protein
MFKRHVEPVNFVLSWELALKSTVISSGFLVKHAYLTSDLESK